MLGEALDALAPDHTSQGVIEALTVPGHPPRAVRAALGHTSQNLYFFMKIFPPPQNILVPSQGTSVQNIDGSAPPSTPRSVVEADVAAHAEQLIREVMAEKANARDATMAHLVVDVAPTQADAQTQVNAAVGSG